MNSVSSCENIMLEEPNHLGEACAEVLLELVDVYYDNLVILEIDEPKHIEGLSRNSEVP